MKNIHQQFIQESLVNLIGIPYEDLDCWGIAREFYKQIFQIDLPEYFYFDPCDHREISPIITEQRQHYKQVEKPKLGDIILLRVFGVPAHVGIYLDEKTFLHTNQGTGSIVDSLQKYQKRILGFYRYDQTKAKSTFKQN